MAGKVRSHVKRILAIDDSPLVLEALRDALEPDGISVADLADVAGKDLSRELLEFDLILLDVQMPARLRDDVAGVIRKRSRLCGPVVFMSSLPEAELAARTQEAGLDGYILKGCGIGGLIDQIYAWLDGEQPRHSKGSR